MHVLLAASELHPFSKTGGLADAVAALGLAVAKAGCRVTVITPLYRGIQSKYPEIRPMGWPFDLQVGPELVSGQFHRLDPTPGLSIWFVEQAGYFDRPGLYNEGQLDYPDNAQRFLFLSKAAMLAALYHPDPPALIHCHDWQ